MKKFFKVLGLGTLLLMGGCTFVGCVATGVAIETVDQVATEIENENNAQQEAIDKMFENAEWEIVREEYLTKIVTTVENTSDVEIDYLEVNYKLYDEEGVVIEDSWTNATDILPNEKRKIEILVLEDEFVDWSYTVTSSAWE